MTRHKTVDNCFCRRKSPKQEVGRAETCVGDRRRLCDGTGQTSPISATRKRLRIGYNSESFLTKSAFAGINPLSWMKSLRDEICLTAGEGEADLISSESAFDFISYFC